MLSQSHTLTDGGDRAAWMGQQNSFATRDQCLFPVSYHKSTLISYNHHCSRSPTAIKLLLWLNLTNLRQAWSDFIWSDMSWLWKARPADRGVFTQNLPPRQQDVKYSFVLERSELRNKRNLFTYCGLPQYRYEFAQPLHQRQSWPEIICFWLSIRPILVNALSQELLKGISSNLVRMSTWTQQRTA